MKKSRERDHSASTNADADSPADTDRHTSTHDYTDGDIQPATLGHPVGQFAHPIGYPHSRRHSHRHVPDTGSHAGNWMCQ